MNNNYDIIIIGAGISGLMAGALLAKEGKKVLILEAHTEIGGYLSGFTRKGYYFDAGLTRSNLSYLEKYFDEAGILDSLQFTKINGDYYVNGRYIPNNNLREYFEAIAGTFHDQKHGIMSFYRHEIAARENGLKTLIYSDYKHMSKLQKYVVILRIFAMMPGMSIDNASRKNENTILKKYVDENSQAFAFLCTRQDQVNHRGYGKMFYYVARMLTQYYNYYPREGYLHLCNQLKRVITQHDGELFINARVSKILIENNTATGIEYRTKGQKERVKAQNIISAMDVNKALRELVGIEFIAKSELYKLENSTLGSSIPVLFLGVRIPPERIRQVFNGKEELNYYPTIKKLNTDPNDTDFFVDCPMVIHSSSLVNPAHAPEKCSNIQIYLPCPHAGWQNDWGLINGHRTETYRELKKKVIEDILSSLEKLLPELKDRTIIDVCELGTPFTNERYTGNTHGVAVGFNYNGYHLSSGTRSYFYHLNNINNLFFIGHQTGARGALGTALGSAHNIVKKIA